VDSVSGLLADRSETRIDRILYWDDDMPSSITLQINGAKRTVNVDAAQSLLEVLRDELGLTGAKYGCGEGQCGACTVMLDGRAIRSCTTAVGTAAGKRVTTIEGLAKDGRLHPVQQAFIDATAMQCGYCTAGMIMSAVALLDANPRPSDQDIARGMEGNICRCCTYSRIVTAVSAAAKAIKPVKPVGASKGGAQ
jgi:aerobic-type carbon monoxide dehydrogenase small subunit (CoxS/CutS family)